MIGQLLQHIVVVLRRAVRWGFKLAADANTQLARTMSTLAQSHKCKMDIRWKHVEAPLEP